MKFTTMKFYLRVDSSAPLHHKQLDPILDTHSLEAQCIKDFFSEVKRWESMQIRREPVTVKMALHMHKNYTNKHPDRLESVP